MLEWKAKLNSAALSYEGKFLLTLEIEQGASRDKVETLRGKDLRVSVKEWKEKRSRDANAYYWVLLSKLAGKLGMSNAELHNRMLRECGCSEVIGGKLVYLILPDTAETEARTLQSESYHVCPTTEVKIGKDGIVYRTYKMLRGSHSYDTEEFSKLLNGLIEGCKENGIPTETPNQIAAMMALYKPRSKA